MEIGHDANSTEGKLAVLEELYSMEIVVMRDMGEKSPPGFRRTL